MYVPLPQPPLVTPLSFMISPFCFGHPTFPSLPRVNGVWLRRDRGLLGDRWGWRGGRLVGGGGGVGWGHWVCQVRQNDGQEGRKEGRRDSPCEELLFMWRDLEQPEVSAAAQIGCCNWRETQFTQKHVNFYFTYVCMFNNLCSSDICRLL